MAGLIEFLPDLDKFSDEITLLDVIRDSLDETERYKVREFIACLDRKDYDIAELYFYRGLLQSTISKILGISQGDVSYRVDRLVEKIKFQMELMSAPIEEMLKLYGAKYGSEDLFLIEKIIRLNSQTAVAKELGVSQSVVSKRVLKVKKNLTELGLEKSVLFKSMSSWNLSRGLVLES